VSTDELKRLVDWCDYAETNAEFWQRFVAACGVYGVRVRVLAAYLALVAGYEVAL
jgi:hypothetical protein